jgi:hypothetical protein
MFQTDEAWEAVSASVVIQRIFEQPGLRHYPMVEMSENTPIYHLLMLTSGESADLRLWQRFLCVDLKTTQELATTEGVVEQRIFEQSGWSEDNGFTLTELAKIDRVKTEGRHLYFATMVDGSLGLDRRWETIDDLARQNAETVWTLKGSIA